MSKSESKADAVDLIESNPRKLMAIALVAMAVAAAPHFFLEMPIEFYQADNMRGWLGLSIWSPVFLGAVALFFGIDIGARTDAPWTSNLDLRAAVGVALPVVVLVLLGYRYFGAFQTVGDWDELGLAMVLYAGTFAIGALFWQGLVQHGLAQALGEGFGARVGRIGLIAVAGVGLWLPFLVDHSLSSVRETIDGYFLIYLALAVLFELGLSVFVCMSAAAVMGVAWAWVHQMTFF